MRLKVNQMGVCVRELFTNKARRLIVEKLSLTFGRCFVEKRERLPIFAQNDLCQQQVLEGLLIPSRDLTFIFLCNVEL